MLGCYLPESICDHYRVFQVICCGQGIERDTKHRIFEILSHVSYWKYHKGESRVVSLVPLLLKLQMMVIDANGKFTRVLYFHIANWHQIVFGRLAARPLANSKRLMDVLGELPKRRQSCNFTGAILHHFQRHLIFGTNAFLMSMLPFKLSGYFEGQKRLEFKGVISRSNICESSHDCYVSVDQVYNTLSNATEDGTESF